jgi:glycosyl transferase family 2
MKALRRRLAHALDRRFAAVQARLDEIAKRLERLEAVTAVEVGRDAETRRLLSALSGRINEELAPALRLMAANDAGARRRLDAARLVPDYELAYEDPDPLVSVIIPTCGRGQLLADRALPSLLAQTHARIEVLVIGDAAGPDTAAALERFKDSRIEYVNLTQRYDYPDRHRHWLAATTLARNEGYRRARGRWLFDADDDDRVPDDAIERLLAHAREERLEAVQGTIREQLPDGSSRSIDPTVTQLPLKGAVVHSHLRFFDREHVASAFGVPGDWFRGERMVRAGVRIGFVDWVTYDYYPSSLWAPEGWAT